MNCRAIKFRDMSILSFPQFSLLRCDRRSFIYIQKNTALKFLAHYYLKIFEILSLYVEKHTMSHSLKNFPLIPKFCSLNFEQYAFWKLAKQVHMHLPVLMYFMIKKCKYMIRFPIVPSETRLGLRERICLELFCKSLLLYCLKKLPYIID